MSKFISIIQQSDASIFFMFNDRVKCKLLDFIMPLITHLGSSIFTISFSILMVLVDLNSSNNWGLAVAASLSVSHIIVHIVKRIINRPRPNKVLENVNTFNIRLYSYSFPSGHTTAAFSIGISLACIFPMLAPLTILLAALVGISRMYVGVHYPTDVIAGALVGTITAIYTTQIILMF